MHKERNWPVIAMFFVVLAIILAIDYGIRVASAHFDSAEAARLLRLWSTR